MNLNKKFYISLLLVLFSCNFITCTISNSQEYNDSSFKYKYMFNTLKDGINGSCSQLTDLIKDKPFITSSIILTPSMIYSTIKYNKLIKDKFKNTYRSTKDKVRRGYKSTKVYLEDLKEQIQSEALEKYLEAYDLYDSIKEDGLPKKSIYITGSAIASIGVSAFALVKYKDILNRSKCIKKFKDHAENKDVSNKSIFRKRLSIIEN